MSEPQRTSPTVVFVDDPAAVSAALDPVAAEVVGVDVERADADRYYRRAALVQVGIPGYCVLLDGVTMPALPELDALLGPGRLAVLHAVENDLEPLARMGVRPDRLADTAVAAALLGLPTGLGPLLHEVLGIALDGDKSAFQRADWEARPLTAEMTAYAAGDVVDLPTLWAELAARLAATGRSSWYEQELAWTVERAASETRDWTRVKGIGRLDPRQRAVVRALWEEREQLAQRHDLAPNRLLHDDVLRDLASDPPRTEAQLVRRSQRRRGLLRRHAPALMAALERGQQAEPETRDRGDRRWVEVDRKVFDALRRRRAELAEELGIDAGVLCSSRPLWSALASDPTDGEALCRAADLRPWQTELLAGPLWEAYLEASAPAAEPATTETPAAEPAAETPATAADTDAVSG